MASDDDFLQVLSKVISEFTKHVTIEENLRKILNDHMSMGDP